MMMTLLRLLLVLAAAPLAVLILVWNMSIVLALEFQLMLLPPDKRKDLMK